MADHSAIQWTDATWNPTTGCTKVSPGCANCYIERTPAFRIAGRKFVKGATDVQLHDDRLEQPLRWKKPRRVFVNSLSDLFHPDVPDEFIDQVFAVMALCPQHTFQVLTKRPDRMLRYCRSDDSTNLEYEPDLDGEATRDALIEGQAQRIYAKNHPGDDPSDWLSVHQPLPNVWLGTSIENRRWLERADVLKDIPAAVHFLSLEPLLEDLGALILDGIEWVIVGGESGAHARPCDIDWIRSVVHECLRQDVPCFVKQLGSVPIMNEARWRAMNPKPLLSARNHRRVRSGIVPLFVYRPKADEPSEWPEDLRVREFPRVLAL